MSARKRDNYFGSHCVVLQVESRRNGATMPIPRLVMPRMRRNTASTPAALRAKSTATRDDAAGDNIAAYSSFGRVGF